MGRKCNVYGCRGNYPGEPYAKVVSFPDKDEYPDEWERWIEAMPNERKTLEELKEIWVCATHFNCEWKKVRGGKRPTAPPCVFSGMPKSRLKQASSHARSTSATSEKRAQNDAERAELFNRIKDFKSFCKEIGDRYRQFNVIYNDGDDLYLSMTDPTGQKVIRFVHF